MLIAIVPSLARPSLPRALASIRGQTLVPNETMVCLDAPGAHARFPGVTTVANHRTQNVSGAINSCLAELLMRDDLDIESTVIAILDDDDEWLPNHAETLMRALHSRDFAWSGICWRQTASRDATPMPVATQVSQADFLVGNPYVQGSNLFVRLPALLKAGGFDEALPSSTDRDLIIRLLDLGAKGVGIDEHTVIHDATRGDRLSSAQSPGKEGALNRFFRKYRHRMNPGQQRAFWNRASDLFGAQERSEPPRAPGHWPLAAADDSKLWLGFCSDAPAAAAHIAASSRTMADATLCIAFGESAQRVARAVWSVNPGAFVILPDEQASNAQSSRYGPTYADETTQQGIAYGRQVLQTELLRRGNDDVFWIVDDDCDISNCWWGEPPTGLDSSGPRKVIGCMEEHGIDIGIGALAGGAPLPGIATLRMSLLDRVARLPANEEALLIERGRHSEYYYDLSDAHTSHLETPLPLDGSARWVWQRHAWSSNDGIPTRGGNTIVRGSRALGALTQYDATMPKRRGDTMVAARARANCVVKHIPFHVLHAAAPRSVAALAADIEGAARARNAAGWSGADVDALRRRRIGRCRENGWRILGLLDAARHAAIDIPEHQQLEAIGRALTYFSPPIERAPQGLEAIV